jgi:glycerol-1-phosphate dehydrogenase [NAD(P)+]
VLTLGIYENLICQRPDREKALAHARNFDHAGWEAQMRRMFGKTAENVIEIERKAGKNDAVKHAARLERILETWPQLVQIMREELPSQAFVRELLVSTGAPVTPAQIGIDRSEVRDALMASREIRDKYIASSLLWDLGVLDEYDDALVA